MKIVKHTHWSQAAATGLGETLRDGSDWLQQQVNTGNAQLWQIEDHSWMLTRTDYLEEKPELVICCYKGKDLTTMAPFIIASAKAQGFGSIRYHTQRKGLNRLLAPFQFDYLETIYQRVL